MESSYLDAQTLGESTGLIVRERGGVSLKRLGALEQRPRAASIFQRRAAAVMYHSLLTTAGIINNDTTRLDDWTTGRLDVLVLIIVAIGNIWRPGHGARFCRLRRSASSTFPEPGFVVDQLHVLAVN